MEEFWNRIVIQYLTQACIVYGVHCISISTTTESDVLTLWHTMHVTLVDNFQVGGLHKWKSGPIC